VEHESAVHFGIRNRKVDNRGHVRATSYVYTQADQNIANVTSEAVQWAQSV